MSLDYQKTPSGQRSEVEPQLDQLKLQAYMQELRDKQNLTMGISAGAIAALIGAIAWATLTAITQYQIGFMAIGVGYVVGWSIRYFGEGIDKSFAIAGAALSLIGCLLGNLLSSCIFIAGQTNSSITGVFFTLDINTAVKIMSLTFSPIDLLFYGLALYFGYKYSLFTIPEEKMKELVKAG
jgi:hypothetical protein